MMWFILASGVWAGAQTGSLDLNPHIDYSAPASASTDASRWVQTRERDVTIGGVAFRQIEYKGEIFRVRLQQGDPQVDCERVPIAPDTYAVEAEAKLTRRTYLYMQSLRQICFDHRIVTIPNLDDSGIGVKIRGAKPGDADKKFIVNPLQQTGTFNTSF